MDITKAIVAGVEERDHKHYVVKAGEDLSDEILALMEADGYRFACAQALENGDRAVYFTRESEPQLRM